MKYLRLFIVYARDAIAQQQIERELSEVTHHLRHEAGYEYSHVISQDDGLMIGLLTVWMSREHALRFHSSGLNKLLVVVTQLRITGTPVDRLFRIIR